MIPRERRSPVPATAALVSVLLAAAVTAVRPTTAAASCVAIEGGKLLIRPAAGNRHSKVKWKAKDRGASPDFIVSDPTRGAVTVELLATGQTFSVTVGPAAPPAWKAKGSPLREWSYKARKDPAAADGVLLVRSSRDLFLFKGKDGFVDQFVAPLALPATLRVTDGTGACFEATFSACTKNDDKKVKCEADPPTCSGGGLPALTGADRAVILDPSAAVAFPDPNPLRAANIDILNSGVGTLSEQVGFLDDMFGSASDVPGKRRLRLDFRDIRWPTQSFDANCEWAGVVSGNEPEPQLDQVLSYLSPASEEIMLRLWGTPAFLSPDCDPVGCAGRMRPGGACTCTNPDKGGFSRFPPRSYGPKFQQYWACVLKHYAARGVRLFEVWNEPDQTPGSFRRNPGDPASAQQQFIEMFANIVSVLKNVRDTDPALAPIRNEIKIGGPTLSRYDAGIETTSPSMPVILSNIDQTVGPLDFVSFHLYSIDPGEPFAAGVLEQVRDWVPPSWPNVELSVNEWQTWLTVAEACDWNENLEAPVAGHGPSVGCDHRGAGFAAYILAGFLAADTAFAPDGFDVGPYVFEVNDRGDRAPDDFYESGMGLLTAHALPKPEAALIWAGSQLRGQMLGVGHEVLGDRSLGWIAAEDESGTVHMIAGQFDSSADMHFTRVYRAAGYSNDNLIADCQCTSGDSQQEASCVQGKLTAIAAAPDRAGAIASECPGADAGETAAMLDGLAARDARASLVGQPLRLALGLEGAPCGRSYTVEVFEFGPGQSTTAAFRAMQGPPSVFGEFDGLHTDAEWLQLQSDLWADAKTPTQVVTATGGQPLEPITVPAYGAVYVRVRP